MNQFVYGSFTYDYLLFRQDRKTLSLIVKPDLRIIVKVPQGISLEKVEVFLKRKWFWLEKQLCSFKKYNRKIYKKEYISGESFFYLGRQYELIVKNGIKDTVMLSRGKIVVTTTRLVTDSIYNKFLLKRWYGHRTLEIFRKRFLIMTKKFKFDCVPEMVIQKMSKRWGSYISNRKVILNPLLINASTSCIDYVITHEFCHFSYKNHNKAFYCLLEKKYPSWKKIKEKLENKYVYL